MTAGPVGVGLVGAGAISDQYLATFTTTPDVRVVRLADLDVDRARRQADRYGITAAGDVDDLLHDDAVEVVVNLTIPAAHAEVTRVALESGRHVWSEKPLALTRRDGRALLDEAAARGLLLGCAPDTLLGPGAQRTQQLVAAGAIGRPVSALAVVQNPGPEAWHPNPAFLFDRGAGPLFDLGPYYVLALVQHLGPVARVTASASTARPTRSVGSGPLAGTEFAVRVPTGFSALLEMREGATAVLVASFESEIERSLVEITGSAGSIEVPQPTEFAGAPVLHLPGGRTRAEQPSGAAAGRGVGVVDLARAVRGGEAPRAGGALGYHVLDTLRSIEQSAAEGRTVQVESSCDRPPLLPEGWDARAATL